MAHFDEKPTPEPMCSWLIQQGRDFNEHPNKYIPFQKYRRTVIATGVIFMYLLNIMTKMFIIFASYINSTIIVPFGKFILAIIRHSYVSWNKMRNILTKYATEQMTNAPYVPGVLGYLMMIYNTPLILLCQVTISIINIVVNIMHVMFRAFGRYGKFGDGFTSLIFDLVIVMMNIFENAKPLIKIPMNYIVENLTIFNGFLGRFGSWYFHVILDRPYLINPYPFLLKLIWNSCMKIYSFATIKILISILLINFWLDCNTHFSTAFLRYVFVIEM